ncbi:MAG: succinyl-diaminopimelate desuccinylase [Pseudomonadota bacterium]
MPDPVALTQALIRCPSVTPAEGGAIALLEDVLAPFGFTCHRADRGGIANLYARWGTGEPFFAFAGHTDVVPIGDEAAWSADPFGAEISDGHICGRGATDMKSGVAAAVAAACGFAATHSEESGSIALLITGDEEGEARDGTRAILDWMRAHGEAPDVCVVGEPTCPQQLGDMMKIGRRGSMTGFVTASGVQGHSAYPHRARNPLPPLIAFLGELAAWRLDDGTEHFDPSTLALTTIDVGNPANNVIPAAGRATFNIRFNDCHTSAALIERIEAMADAYAAKSGVEFSIRWKVSGEAFLTEPGALSALVASVVAEETGLTPDLSTTGGTSDARFIKDLCPVVEFGLVGKTMHQVDERVPVAEVEALSRIYGRILERFFTTRP